MGLYYKVEVSAENHVQAGVILDSLLAKRLVTGGQFIAAPARFLWKGEITNMRHYVTITSFTTGKHKEAIMADVRHTSVEDVPMITFTVLDALNQELRDWVDQTVA
jgi:uncharacterized protein involved in tolerance to divalent cations